MACAALSPEIRSSSRRCTRFARFSSSACWLEVALAVLERLQAALQVGVLHLERLRLAQRALLHPRDLLPARL